MWQTLTDYLQTVQLLQPGWLWATPLSVGVILWLQHHRRLAPPGTVAQLVEGPHLRHPRVSILRAIERRQANTAVTRERWRAALGYGVLLVCLHLALAQPFRLGQQMPDAPRYRDTLFLVDTSVSMVLRDYLVGGERVDRMTMLKSVLTHFIDGLEGNRIGVIAYSEQPYTLVPLTTDYPLLKTMIRRLEPAVLTGRTSDVGRGLLYALQQLGEHQNVPAQQLPVLVLVSDVDRSNRDLDPRAIAAQLADRGYRLHSIGIGASSYDAREEDYRGLIYHPANFSFLEQIAQSGGGRFFWADNADSLAAAMREIQSAEKRSVETEPVYVRLPLYQWPLLAGLAMLGLLQLWPGRRPL